MEELSEDSSSSSSSSVTNIASTGTGLRVEFCIFMDV